MYIIFKDKKSKRSHKAVGIKVFLTFLLVDKRIQIRSRIRIHTSDWWIRIRIQEAQKHVDSDSDPQHCFLQAYSGIIPVIHVNCRLFLYWSWSWVNLGSAAPRVRLLPAAFVRGRDHGRPAEPAAWGRVPSRRGRHSQHGGKVGAAGSTGQHLGEVLLHHPRLWWSWYQLW